jgi:predicted PurR-regulated permease PerM
MKPYDTEKVRQFFFILVLAVLAIILFTYLKSFLPSFLGAITFYVLMRRHMKRMLLKGWKPASAALILMLFSFIMILFPVFILINTVSSKIGYVIDHATEITSSLVDFLKNIEIRVGYHFMNADTIRNLSGIALSELPLILGATVNSIVALVVMYFLLYFMLTNCNQLEDWSFIAGDRGIDPLPDFGH